MDSQILRLSKHLANHPGSLPVAVHAAAVRLSCGAGRPGDAALLESLAALLSVPPTASDGPL